MIYEGGNQSGSTQKLTFDQFRLVSFKDFRWDKITDLFQGPED